MKEDRPSAGPRYLTASILAALLIAVLAIPKVIEAFREDARSTDAASADRETRRQTLMSHIGEGGPAALTAFRKALLDDDPICRVIACHGLAYLDVAPEPHLEKLIGMLTHPDRDVRGYAVGALGEIGHPMAVPALRELENDPDRIFRITVYLGLARCGDNPEARLKSMVQMLRDPDWMVRVNALKAIAKLGKAAAPAVRIISGMVQQHPWQVRLAVIEALLEIEPSDPYAQAAFDIATRDPETRVRKRALAIGRARTR